MSRKGQQLILDFVSVSVSAESACLRRCLRSRPHDVFSGWTQLTGHLLRRCSFRGNQSELSNGSAQSQFIPNRQTVLYGYLQPIVKHCGYRQVVKSGSTLPILASAIQSDSVKGLVISSSHHRLLKSAEIIPPFSPYRFNSTSNLLVCFPLVINSVSPMSGQNPTKVAPRCGC